MLSSSALLRRVISDSRTLDETDRLPIDPGIAASEITRPAGDVAKLAGALEVRGLTFGYQPGDPASSRIWTSDSNPAPGSRSSAAAAAGSRRSRGW